MIIIDEKTIKAEEGMVLTCGETFGKTVHLGRYDSIDNWYEVTEEEAERLQNAETPTETEATEADLKAQAYDILMGVTE